MPASVAVSNSNSVYDTSGLSRTGEPYRVPSTPTYTSQLRTRVDTHLRRRLIGGREIGHIHDHMPGSGDRPLHLGHVRLVPRKVPQLRGVRDEHPPLGAATRAIRTSRAHHASVGSIYSQLAGILLKQHAERGSACAASDTAAPTALAARR